jgi:HEAT repeat protein
MQNKPTLTNLRLNRILFGLPIMSMLLPLNRFIVLTAALSVAAATSLQADERQQEQQLLAVLRSDAPAAEKAITCKRLAIHGSSAAVADLAKLLPDEQLSSWARIALEAIPGDAADAALRDATDSLQGLLLVGTINSIGVRRDAQAVELLTTHLQNSDGEAASAAAVALGRIGNAAATKALRNALTSGSPKVRSAVAEGCILCAERLLSEGKTTEAAELYDQVRAAEVPQQRVIEATRGAILARGQDGIELLLEQFRSPDKKLFQLALGTAREFPGGNIDRALAVELPQATPERAALIVQAMADRPETVILSTVLTAARQGPKPVRGAAIVALGRVGDESCLSALLEIALDADVELTELAKATLGTLPGSEVDARILAMLPNAKGKMVALLIDTVGERRIDATPTLVKALDHSDGAMRGAALRALGETVTLQGLSVLVSQVVAPNYSEDAPAAQQALKAASIRMPDREGCAAEISAAIGQSKSVSTKVALLQILGEMGGPKALATIGTAAKSDDADLQDISTQLLGKWMTEDAAPVLLDLAKTTPAEKYQIRALRGYIRIARQFRLSNPERSDMCRQAFEAARRPDEQKMVLEILQRHPSKANLKLATEASQIPELEGEAKQVATGIARKLGVPEGDSGK